MELKIKDSDLGEQIMVGYLYPHESLPRNTNSIRWGETRDKGKEVVVAVPGIGAEEAVCVLVVTRPERTDNWSEGLRDKETRVLLFEDALWKPVSSRGVAQLIGGGARQVVRDVAIIDPQRVEEVYSAAEKLLMIGGVLHEKCQPPFWHIKRRLSDNSKNSVQVTTVEIEWGDEKSYDSLRDSLAYPADQWLAAVEAAEGEVNQFRKGKSPYRKVAVKGEILILEPYMGMEPTKIRMTQHRLEMERLWRENVDSRIAEDADIKAIKAEIEEIKAVQADKLLLADARLGELEGRIREEAAPFKESFIYVVDEREL